MSMRIIKLSEAMSSKIHQLECHIFSDPYSEQTLTKDFRNPSYICFAAVNGDDVTGYCICSTVLGEAELHRIAVDEKSRGQGIASSMMIYLKKQCVQNCVDQVYLEVRKSNTAARRLYEKHGFVQTGERKAYYRDNGEDAILYTMSFNRR